MNSSKPSGLAEHRTVNFDSGPGLRLLAGTFCALVVVTTFGVFSGVRHNGFVWDTVPFVLENPWLSHPGLHDFIAMFTRYYQANWQPMVWLSHALDFALFGHNPALNHFSNVAYHAADACLLYWLTVLLLQGRSYTSTQVHVIGLLAALMFAVNPQHVQSVAWLVERKDTLYVLFTLLCLISYLRARRAQAGAPGKSLPLICFALALMAKPMAVTVPVVLLLLDVEPLGRWEGNLRSAAKLIAEKWLYWLMSLGVVLVTLHTQQMAMVSIHTVPLWVRVLTAINNSFFYVYCYLVPVNLSPFYPYSQSLVAIRHLSYWLPGTIFLVGSLLLCLWLWSRGKRWPLLMLAFYLVTLLPVCGLIAVGPSRALNYYSYLATAPLGLMIAMGIVSLWRMAGSARAALAGVAISYILALALLSVEQVRFWRNELTLWTRAYQLYPASPYINRNLASAYVAIGDYKQALIHAKISAQGNPLGDQYLKQLEAALRAERSD